MPTNSRDGYERGRTLELAAPSFSPTEAMAIAHEAFGIEASEAREFACECDQLFRIGTVADGDFSLRISHPAQDPASIELQNAALDHAVRSDGALPIPRLRRTIDGASVFLIRNVRGDFAARLMTYLPGVPLAGRQAGPRLLADIGRILARFDRSLQDFSPPAVPTAPMWDVGHADQVAELSVYVDDDELRVLVDRAFGRFRQRVAPAMNRLRSQVIHNDLNPKNILVKSDRSESITGIVDFGDMIEAPLIFDLGVALSKQLDVPDPVASACHLLDGYVSVLPLADDEVDILMDVAITRAAMRVPIRCWRATRNPDAPVDVSINASTGRILKSALSIEPGAVLQRHRTQYGHARARPQ